MLEEMVRAVMKKLIATNYPHLKLPAVLFARVDAVSKLDTCGAKEVTVHADGTGERFQGHIDFYWYGYKLTVLDRFGSPDPSFPPLPQVESKLELQEGAVVAVALPYGDITPAILGEVRL